MKNKIEEGKESLDRMRLLMNYNPKNTLTENLEKVTITESPVAGEIYAASYGPGTDEEKILNAILKIKSIDEFKQANEKMKTYPPKMDIVGMLNNELDLSVYVDREILQKIHDHLKPLGVHLSFKPYKNGSISVTFTNQPSQSPQAPGSEKSVVTPGITPPEQVVKKPAYVWKESPFKNKQEGDLFRKWMNDNFPDFSKQIKLDPQGSYNNSYIKKAWTSTIPDSTYTYGSYYSERTGSTDMAQIQTRQSAQAPVTEPTAVVQGREIPKQNIAPSNREKRLQGRIDRLQGKLGQEKARPRV